MRIGIDVRYLSHGLIGGVHTYVASFVPELIKLATDHEIFLYADRKRPFELSDLPGHVTVRFLPYRNPVSSIINDLFMRNQMARDRLDVVHFPANYGFGPKGARKIITLHDQLTIMPLRETLGSRGSPRSLRRDGMTIYLYFMSRLALRDATYLLTVSEYSRREIAKYGPFDPQRIVVAPSAPANDMVRIEDATTLLETRNRLGLKKPFVLADALKNPGVIVRAWRLLPSEIRNEYEIVFFSRRPELLPIVHEAVAEGSAKLLLRVSRRDLAALYTMANIFIFPSWFEGLGLPLIEAMRCGAPIIASDRCSIPEVTAGAALLCDAEDEHGLAEHIKYVLMNPDEANQMRMRGFRRAEDFSWVKTSQRILQCYEQSLYARLSHATIP